MMHVAELAVIRLGCQNKGGGAKIILPFCLYNRLFSKLSNSKIATTD